RRPHFGRDMEVLLSLRKDVHPALGAFPVLLLDRVLPHLKVLWDISGIPWDNSPKNRSRGLVNETLDQYKTATQVPQGENEKTIKSFSRYYTKAG
ncbi:MAG: hypothetical protein ABIM21_04625, partial [candidate division WOR-3 bacterium]